MREITLDTSTGILEAVESHLFWRTDYEDIQIILQSKDIESKLENYNSQKVGFSITTNMYIPTTKNHQEVVWICLLRLLRGGWS